MTPLQDASPENSAPTVASYDPALMEDLHRNIAFANAYRMELIKFLMAISAALLTFTVTFRPMLETVQWAWAMWASWSGLALSMVGGMVNMMGWDRFYMSYRDVDYKVGKSKGRIEAVKQGKEKRRKIDLWRKTGMWVQYVCFAVGVIGAAGFAAANIDHVRKADDQATQINVGTPSNTRNIAPVGTVTTIPPAKGHDQ